MTSVDAALEIRNLRHSYTENSVVLDIPEFRVGRGEMLFLHGPSGSGKTTLLSLVTGVLPVQSGKLSVLGQPMDAFNASQRDALRAAKMGYIFQVFNLLPFLTVMENIQLPLQMSRQRLAHFKNKDEVKQNILDLAGRLGIGQLLDRCAGELSVGQQQRVAAARALVGEPELIVADEPTSALDSELRQSFVETLFAQARLQNSGVLFVSHDKSLMPLFDRSVALAEINMVMKGKNP